MDEKDFYKSSVSKGILENDTSLWRLFFSLASPLRLVLDVSASNFKSFMDFLGILHSIMHQRTRIIWFRIFSWREYHVKDRYFPVNACYSATERRSVVLRGATEYSNTDYFYKEILLLYHRKTFFLFVPTFQRRIHEYNARTNRWYSPPLKEIMRLEDIIALYRVLSFCA